jgi:sugar phosphate isomerase/epimerase
MTERDPAGKAEGRGLSRRQMIRGTLAGLSCAAIAPGAVAATQKKPSPPLSLTPMPKTRFCLNTSTIRGQDSRVGVVDQVRIAAEAGYDAIEPWIRDLDAFVEGGGSLKDLGARIEDAGLAVPSAIGFARWAVDDDAERAAGLEEARRNMAMLAEIGGTRLAAPPVGLTDQKYEDLLTLADRYATLLELGEEMGVVPQLEVWGFSKTFSRLGEVAFVAVESGRADACILPDVYHIYKGGSSLEGLRNLNGQSIQVFHLNDYPADPPRGTITDADRVFPGDGVAPFGELMAILDAIGFDGVFSLELFNREYWQRDPLEVAKEGLRKMKAATGMAG